MKPRQKARKSATPQAAEGGASAVDFPWIAEGLRYLAVAVGEFNVDPGNAAKHTKGNVKAIRESLKAFGQVKAIKVNRRTHLVAAGNGTVLAARQLGWSHLAVVWTDDDPLQHVRYAIGDNRAADLAEWDAAKRNEAAAAIGCQFEDLYAAMKLDQFLAEAAGKAGEESPIEEPPAEAQEVTERYMVAVVCRSAGEQGELFRRFKGEGRKCRKLVW